ncbi:enoyl-CoA hydratase/isomerase family protein [Nocardioides sp. WS12]|uniref:enoyl-CoA hydratase/isomerase family protein n=1 Tax=Nocardioides sp. WS12 TaxID=2486272 RepID=UPI0015FD31C9|nr:enoyl-CoA hydratase/isomerase family protein [Nocardioides sp. WS12]
MGIQVTKEGACALITLDWPERRNALPPDDASALILAINGATADQEIKALVLTGNGAFSAGGDLKGMVSRKDMPAAERKALVYSIYQNLVRTLLDCPVPTFAAIDGPAVGLGLDMALACDWRLFGPDGWCRQGWGGLGLLPGTGGELLLRLKAPNAMWQMLPGQRKVDGAVAERLGLGERAEPTAVEVAVARGQALEPMPRNVVTHYARMGRTGVRSGLDEYLEKVLKIQLPLLTDPDFADRAQASLGGGGHDLVSEVWTN